MTTRKDFMTAYRTARKAVQESNSHKTGCFSIRVVDITGVLIGIDVIRPHRLDHPLLRCYGRMGETIARVMMERDTAAFHVETN